MSALRARSRSVTELLIALVGPAIWFAHFSAVYATQGFVCAIAQDRWAPGEAAAYVWFGLLLLSAIAIVALGSILILGYRRAERDRSDANTTDHWRFLHYLQVAITGLALVAVLWTTLAVILVEPCVSVFGKI